MLESLPALAWRRTSTCASPRGACDRGKGVHTSGRITWVLHGRATSLDHWFDVLDRFGGVEKGHTAAARHLFEAHGVAGWYAQGITVAYERARGVRVLNQRGDGGYEVSVSKVLPTGTSEAVKAFTNAPRRRRWIRDADPGLVTALSAGLSGASAKGFIVKPNGQARLRYAWDGTVVAALAEHLKK